MDINKAKLIEILDPVAEEVRETSLAPRPPEPMPLFEVGHGGRSMTLWEAATTYTATFPQMLLSGLKAILFTSYAGYPNTHELWCDVQRSNKPDEQYLEGSTIGVLPLVSEGAPYPNIALNLDRGVKITNYKRGAIITVTKEMLMFDQTGLIRQQTQDLGNAMAFSEEYDAYAQLRTTGNYTRTLAGCDNDVGNNYGTTTFSASGLNTALETLRTMRDNKSGRLLGVMPNLLIVGVGVEMAARQLLLSPIVQRVTGTGEPNVQNIYGTGTTNPFRGLVTEIIVSPFLSRYEWVLMERGRAMVKQVVWDLELSEQSAPNSEEMFRRDATAYKASKMYGVGMLNDRFAYYSNSTTAPTVD